MVAGVVAAWWLGGERRWLMAALAAAAGLLVLAPWVAFNLERFERPVILTTNDGTTIRGANCDRTYEGRALGSWAVECLVIDPDVAGMEGSLRGARWRSDGIEYARDHAGRIPVVVLARLGRSARPVRARLPGGRGQAGRAPPPGVVGGHRVVLGAGRPGGRRPAAGGAVRALRAVGSGGGRPADRGRRSTGGTASAPPWSRPVVLGAALAVVALVERRIGPAAGSAAETEGEPPSSPEPEVTSTSALTAT